MGLGFVEILCTVGFLLPALGHRFALLSPLAAGVIAAEMLLFCALHLTSGEEGAGQLVYWLVIAALTGFVVYGRVSLSPN
jgi:hypothetical protein